MNALNKLIQERFTDITQGASADVYPLNAEEVKFIEDTCAACAEFGTVGTDIIDETICYCLEARK